MLEWKFELDGQCLTLTDPDGNKHYGRLEVFPNFVADGGKIRGKLYLEDSVRGIAVLQPVS